MRSRTFTLATLLTAVALVTLTTAAHAQSRAKPLPSGKAFDLTPYVGYMVFGDFISGPLGTSIGSAPAPVYGAQIGMHLAPSLSVVGNLATTSSDVKAGIPILGGLTLAHSRMVMYDGGLQYDIPTSAIAGTSVSPFVQAGAGAIRYDISQSFMSVKATNFAANLGFGADAAIGNNVGLRIMVKDYIGKFDFKEATLLDFEGKTAHNFAFSGGVRLSF